MDVQSALCMSGLLRVRTEGLLHGQAYDPHGRAKGLLNGLRPVPLAAQRAFYTVRPAPLDLQECPLHGKRTYLKETPKGQTERIQQKDTSKTRYVQETFSTSRSLVCMSR